MSCLYPANTVQGAYRKGCRCQRCCEAKSNLQREAYDPKPCTECGEPNSTGTRRPRCESCGWENAVRRIADRVEVTTSGCWVVDCELNNKGYGTIMLAGRRLLTHRVMYEHWVGLIGSGLELDHLCRTRACCNPDHLEPVTHRDNLLRGHALRRAGAA